MKTNVKFIHGAGDSATEFLKNGKKVNRMTEKQEKRMTGSEAWSMVAPILARFVSKDDEFIDAYTTVYRALKKLDEAEKGETE